jgi:hypothetical protein
VKCLLPCLFILCNLFVFRVQVIAQETNSFNLNVGNGLPSNHVYGMITDRFGYLWICTDKGVARYNGYSYKLFSVSNGLPTEDVWELLEDRTGRIWLGAISDEVGYILNNKYYKTKLKNIKGTLYPVSLQRRNDGVVFHSSFANRDKNLALCYSNEDTIHSVYINDSYFKSDTEQIYYDNGFAYQTNDELGNVVLIYGKSIYRYPFENGSVNRSKATECTKISALKNSDIFFYCFKYCMVNGDYIISVEYTNNQQEIYLTSIKSGEMKKVSLFSGNEYFQQIYYHKDGIKGAPFYIISNKSMSKCRIDSGKIVVKERYNIDFFVDDKTIKSSKINTFFKKHFWNYCIGTTNNGAYINYNNSDVFSKTDTKLVNYKYVGEYKDSFSFWWNEVQSSFAVLDNKFKVKYYSTTGITNIRGVTYIGADSLFIAASMPCFFDLSKGSFMGLNQNTFAHFGSNFRDKVIKIDSDYYCTSGQSFYKISVNNSKYVRSVFDYDRYNGISYDGFRKKIWAYNNLKIIVNKSGTNEIIDKSNLNALGIKGLEHLCIDSIYGNVFMRGYDNIVMYDYENSAGKALFDKIRFRGNVSMLTYDNKLIVVSSSGVLFSLIKGKMELSEPYWCYNPKSVVYNTIYGCHVMGGKLTINTDKGLFIVDIPTDNQILNNKRSVINDYRFLLCYADSFYNIKSQIGINIGKSERKLVFDVINPYGVGSIRYYYSYSKKGVFKELNSNEITISEWFRPDNRYKIYVYAADDVWKSDIATIDLYVVPYWWQTHNARRIIWVSIVFFSLLVLVAAIFITRRIVLNAAKRRHLQMEMELKSIYAQINPHFIFNTLNSALLLVNKNNMEEAYAHISKFSRLLRSYLKSSRNKFITINEEVENLKNYIELQQTRFKNKFSYKIVMSDEVEKKSIQIPSLLIQPFVENSINHGILQKEEHGNLLIEFKLSEDGEKVICTVDDDGIGRKQSKLSKAVDTGKTESYGDLLIRDLVSIFNKYEDMRIEIVYSDKELPRTGTTVSITINNPKYV